MRFPTDAIPRVGAPDGVYSLTRSTFLPVDRETVFEFFARAENLERITPRELGFEILTPRPLRLEIGATIDYRIRLYGIPMQWRTLIRAWDPPHGFEDVQAKGPYALWIHEHRFLPEGDGTRVEDEVRYRLPLGRLGRAAHPIVRRQLDRIFDYRARTIRALLVGPSASGGMR